MAKVRAILNHIIFQFTDGGKKVPKMNQFAEQTDWGFEFADREASLESARWGIVVSTGPDVPEDIKEGMEVYIDKLKWTTAFEVDGEEYWRTDSDCILLVNDDVEPVAKKYVAPEIDLKMIKAGQSRAY